MINELLEKTGEVLWLIGAAALGLSCALGYLGMRRGPGRRHPPGPSPSQE